MFRKFVESNKGLAAVEFALVLPVLLILLIGSVGAFDLFRADRSVSYAANSIVDLTARQIIVTESTVDTLFATGRALIGRYETPGSVSISVASIISDAGNNLSVDWSRAEGGAALIADGDIQSLDLPNIPPNESVVFIRVENEYTPLFKTNFTFSRDAVRRPRFVAQIAFDSGP